MKKRAVFSPLYFLILLESGLVFGAPIPPIGPFDITGAISEVQWFPERTVEGIPHLSGSAGKGPGGVSPFSGQAGGLRRGRTETGGRYDSLPGLVGFS